MLQCYLDDSGTHNESRVIVWGGLAGDIHFFDEFETAWKNRLADPCDHLKPPIKAFHSTALAAGSGEFAGYSPAERDRTRFNFRQVIVDCGLTWVSCGMSTEAWVRVANGYDFSDALDAEGVVFGSIVRDFCRSAKKHGDPISFQFDLGRQSPKLASMIQPAFETAEIDDQYVSYTFSPVQAIMGLQGADLVAHETYQFLTKYIDDPDTSPTQHLDRLVEDVHDSHVGWFGESQIRSTFEQTAKSLQVDEEGA